MNGTLGPLTVSTKQQRIATLAKSSPGMVMNTLAHHMDLEWMVEAYRRTRKDGAAGVDGVTAEEYEKDLAGNLSSLLERAKSGTYVAPPVRRVYIPKGTGNEKRPLGIPTLEDKVLQRAVVMLLEPVYEVDFLDCSHGFRPKRSPHTALRDLRVHLMGMQGGTVVEIDIRKFYDSLEHCHIRDILRRRVGDGVVLRLIGKWLNAGVMEDGQVWYPETGTPQGGVVSCLLSNIVLHEVLDQWFEQTVKPRLRGKAELVRFADDAVIVMERADDASRVLDVLPKRFGRFGLTLHPEKTRLVTFKRPRPGSTEESRPGTFTFLGFTHYWGRSVRGYWVVKRKTSRERLARATKAVALWCRLNRHLPIREQWRTLCAKLRGHYAYYGITSNSQAMNAFHGEVVKAWYRWLNRRAQARSYTWESFSALIHQHLPLPRPKVLHAI